MSIGIDRHSTMDAFSTDDLKSLLVTASCVCIHGMEMVANSGFVGPIHVCKSVFGSQKLCVT